MNMDSDINSKWQKFLKAKYVIKISFKFSIGALAAFKIPGVLPGSIYVLDNSRFTIYIYLR